MLITILCTAIFTAYAPFSAHSFSFTLEGEIHKSFQAINNISSQDFVVSGVSNEHGAALKDFYSNRNMKPYWHKSILSSYKANIIYKLVNSWTHGLNPENYFVQDLLQLQQKKPSAVFDILLTHAFALYARDLSGMRIEAAELQIEDYNGKEQLTYEETLLKLSSINTYEVLIQDIEPQGKTYKALRQEAIKVAQNDSYDYERYLPIQTKGILRKGDSHKVIPKIRGRLKVIEMTNDPYHYNEAVYKAVKEFQRDNGLYDDGVIGPNTLQRLNQTREEKLLQLYANMERLRWTRPQNVKRYIIVNIPSATLWAIDNGEVQQEMDVIVGSQKRKTKMFHSNIQGIRLNPDWTIPYTIKLYDILPKIIEDEDYIEDKGITLYDGYGSQSQEIDPDDIEWDEITKQELNSIRFVQVPGQHNPLGQVRVLMPNKYNIYLHDTNQPHYFDRKDRALSSGCIRLKEPKKLASFILQSSEEFIEEALLEGKKRDIVAKNTLPVSIFYYTNWVNDQGKVVFGSDIYERDQKLITKLHKANKLALPGQNYGPTFASILSKDQIRDEKKEAKINTRIQ